MSVNYRGLEIPRVSFGAVTSDDLFEEREQQLFDLYEARKEKYRKVLDVGANIGVHALVMAQQGWDVWAYEPDPTHFHYLRVNAESSPHASRIACCNYAVSDRFGHATFVRVKGNTTSSHLKGDKQPHGETEEIEVLAVNCRPLFAWADFAKLDVEGHEAKLLRTVRPDMKCEFLVEIGSEENARAIFEHFRGWRELKTQRSGWAPIGQLEDMPTHYTHGALFIGR